LLFLFYADRAIAAISAIMVPINFRLSADEIRFVLSDVEPKMFFFDPDFEKTVSDIRPSGPSLKEAVILGPARGGYASFDSLMTGRPGKEADVSDDDPFVIIHTAAVQGKPRGAVISHRNLLSCTMQTNGTVGLTHRDAYLNILPLFHIGGLIFALSIFHAAGKNVILSKFDPRTALRMINEEEITLIGDFPPILTQLLDEAEKGEFGLSPLKHVIGVDLPDTVKRFERLGHGTFWLAYGQTETMGLTCLCPNPEMPGSAGRQGPLVDLKIVDEFDREVKTGEKGEITVRGPSVFQGYWKEEELTQYTFREGWHHTGDMGRVDEEGYLWFMGRKAEKELIKSGGENVYPVEVEKVILEHPGIAEVSVIGVPDPKFGEGIKAVCVLKANVRLTEKELIDFVAGRIARYKKPGTVSFVESLPKKEDGSIDRAKVKTMQG
jgi:acyl-CoA synthetase (AMP-forming)/AMP-acid ligase II